jgi:thiamine pyrophosphate-dependent acetolactate synthase large subunit-like protein
MKASDLFVKCLENEGVKSMSSAYPVGRLTGIPRVCLSTLGPGATNLITAAAYGPAKWHAYVHGYGAKTYPLQ